MKCDHFICDNLSNHNKLFQNINQICWAGKTKICLTTLREGRGVGGKRTGTLKRHNLSICFSLHTKHEKIMFEDMKICI